MFLILTRVLAKHVAGKGPGTPRSVASANPVEGQMTGSRSPLEDRKVRLRELPLHAPQEPQEPPPVSPPTALEALASTIHDFLSAARQGAFRVPERLCSVQNASAGWVNCRCSELECGNRTETPVSRRERLRVLRIPGF
ncbi:hypothetical protein EVG20_g7170 [Dentipellis fragilis]|uniref:Uncharacterized protein n=1 Tax=Dentipellis fragilis TaxID=205917 RepID=A0A4Y9YHR4_9AGAM|nr:hypothetical protein EVG20_g7170 [Dentipellis fragilis]